MLSFFICLSLVFAEESYKYYVHQVEQGYQVIYKLNSCLFEAKGRYIQFSLDSNSDQSNRVVLKKIYSDNGCTNKDGKEEEGTKIFIDDFNTLKDTIDFSPINSKILSSCKDSGEDTIIYNYPIECTQDLNSYYKYSQDDTNTIYRQTYFDDKCESLFYNVPTIKSCKCISFDKNTFVELVTCPSELTCKEFQIKKDGECHCIENYRKLEDGSCEYQCFGKGIKVNEQNNGCDCTDGYTANGPQRCTLVCNNNFVPNEENDQCICDLTKGYTLVDGKCIKNEEKETTNTTTIYIVAIIILLLIVTIGIVAFFWYTRKPRSVHSQNRGDNNDAFSVALTDELDLTQQSQSRNA
ncbi:hypothetical protein EDI_057750 [Entamoeba dispar SAW760]|uniref:Uncharacterized protein n=1 Tax=Entamoeba dispar (strain ATCC PRA-260 / SAW760) TaxID=370354 RepID=B0EUF3_ENTDS|nr:uncharacterized protein EDI_057750 [Entamoeba dispar SAW760]EDR21844.1 hypothetical protein EDI_057750 [Entamoeba dispar SAW760]|eukprot:EDR21844.1 hypothetical protein EDI_057750 [Entamoeba dispar SAW760]